jgi:TPR repeat protein
MYCTGNGVAQDIAQGVTWYEAAAQQGHTVAQYNLAVMLGRGQGREADPKKAAEWFQKAAEQGMAEAQIALGDALMSGNGVAQDRDMAVHWYQHAARQRNEGAVRRLKSIGASVVADN